MTIKGHCGFGKYGIPTHLPDGRRNPVYRKIMGRIYRSKYREKIKAGRRRRRADPDYRRREKLRDLYGMPLEQYNMQLIAQDYKCLTCEIRHSIERPLVVDHCHAAKKVRGLLCRACNNVLGFAKDNPEILRKLANYVAAHVD